MIHHYKLISIYSFWIKHLRTIPGEATLCALPAESQGRRPRQTDGLGTRVVVGGFSVGTVWVKLVFILCFLEVLFQLEELATCSFLMFFWVF